MFTPPKTSPWGKVQHCKPLCLGVFEVDTASHGGILVASQMAGTLLSPQARKYGFREGGYVCFEEDAAASVALRELLDKKLIRAPLRFTREEYSRIIDESVQRFYPDYWQAHEKGKAIDGQLTFEAILGGQPAEKTKYCEVR